MKNSGHPPLTDLPTRTVYLYLVQEFIENTGILIFPITYRFG